MTDNRLTGKIEDWQNDRLSKMTGSRLARWLQIEKVEDKMTTDWQGNDSGRWKDDRQYTTKCQKVENMKADDKMSESWQDDSRWQDYREQKKKWRRDDR